MSYLKKKIWNVSEQNLEIFDNNKIFENENELIKMLKVLSNASKYCKMCKSIVKNT